MRAAGATYAEIKAQLGIGSDTLARILGTHGPRRRRLSSEEREKAREMRRKGASVPEISRAFGIAKSTAFEITKGIAWEVSPEGVERRRNQARAYWRAQNARRDDARMAAQRRAQNEVDRMSDRELLLVGAALYWAEGTKAKPWRMNDEYLVFVNSDPDVIRVYLGWLRILGVRFDRLRFRVMIHESADVAAAERHWAGVVGCHPLEFGRATLKRHNAKTVRKNTSANYHGCLVVRVSMSTKEYWRMAGLWHGIVSSVVPPSPTDDGA